MLSCCNDTRLDDTKFCCSSFLVQLIFVVIGALLVISLSGNFFFCLSKCCSGKEACRRQRRSPKQMEDNPIYGNIVYKQEDTEVDPPLSSRDQQPQDCYANLALKPPRPQSGRSSPQIQYSDVVQLEGPPEADKEDEGNTDTSANMSDLYASVQTQRTKTVNTTDTGEDYANHL